MLLFLGRLLLALTVAAARRARRVLRASPRLARNFMVSCTVLLVAFLVNTRLVVSVDGAPMATRVEMARAIVYSVPMAPETRQAVNQACVERHNVAFLGNFLNSANPTKRWGGDVAPSCARRCVGSRLPDHARCSFFVRSRHRAHVLPRRAIRLSAGDLGHAHQNSHICLWLRTTSAGWRSEGKSWTRPTSTEHPPCNVR